MSHETPEEFEVLYLPAPEALNEPWVVSAGEDAISHHSTREAAEDVADFLNARDAQVRRDALEEAAKVEEDRHRDCGQYECCGSGAGLIRALASVNP